MNLVKPMLSGKAPEDLSTIRYPVLCSPKLDGIRCIMVDGVAMSRSMKPIPNRFIQEQLANVPNGVDGELMVGGGFNAVTSGIMSRDGEPDFTFFVFDWIPRQGAEQLGFTHRLAAACCSVHVNRHPRIKVVPHAHIVGPLELAAFDGVNLSEGYEGTMIRDPEGPYKHGRSSTKQGLLMKLKRFDDEEATIIGVEEMMHNANEAEKNELGRTKRSAAKAGLEPMGTLGKFVCVFDDGTEFRCGGGPGLTRALRQEMWDSQSTIIGERATIRFQPDPGGRQKGQAPRIPQFHGLRHQLDQS